MRNDDSQVGIRSCEGLDVRWDHDRARLEVRNDSGG